MQLSPNTSIYQAHEGYVLRTADAEYFELRLPRGDVEELLAALSDGVAPESVAALTALIDAGHVVRRKSLPLVVLRGRGRIADATAKLLGRNVATGGRQADLVCHLSDDAVDPDDVGSVDLASYRDGITQVITPRAVDVADIVGRRRASVTHRDRIQPRHRPLDGGLRLESPLHPVSDRAADVIADLIVAEIADREASSTGRAPYLLTAVDLRSLSVSRHPVLPIPVAPQ
ncbi:hypothetical protein [Williamsia sp.]|uniref:hypothetical protein n=1 Tax=Williamsia sp. TaxID=1872085 RepID=UPI002F95C881